MALSQGSLSCGGLIHKACRLIQYVYGQLGKLPRGPVQRALSWFLLLLRVSSSFNLIEICLCICICITSPHNAYDAQKGWSFRRILCYSLLSCLLVDSYVFLNVKLPSESRQKKKKEGRWSRSSKKECYREAHPNIQTNRSAWSVLSEYQMQSYCATQSARLRFIECVYGVTCDP